MDLKIQDRKHIRLLLKNQHEVKEELAVVAVGEKVREVPG
jgi:hypothetical protein